MQHIVECVMAVVHRVRYIATAIPYRAENCVLQADLHSQLRAPRHAPVTA